MKRNVYEFILNDKEIEMLDNILENMLYNILADSDYEPDGGKETKKTACAIRVLRENFRIGKVMNIDYDLYENERQAKVEKMFNDYYGDDEDDD